MTPAQCRAARALLKWSQPELAARAGLSLSTVVDHERERRTVAAPSVAAMRRALRAAGIEMSEDGRGVRLVGP